MPRDANEILRELQELTKGSKRDRRSGMKPAKEMSGFESVRDGLKGIVDEGRDRQRRRTMEKHQLDGISGAARPASSGEQTIETVEQRPESPSRSVPEAFLGHTAGRITQTVAGAAQIVPKFFQSQKDAAFNLLDRVPGYSNLLGRAQENPYIRRAVESGFTPQGLIDLNTRLLEDMEQGAIEAQAAEAEYVRQHGSSNQRALQEATSFAAEMYLTAPLKALSALKWVNRGVNAVRHYRAWSNLGDSMDYDLQQTVRERRKQGATNEEIVQERKDDVHYLERAAHRGTQQYMEAFKGGATGWAGSFLGKDDMRDAGFKRQQEAMESAAFSPEEIGSIREAFSSPANFALWVAENIVTLMPQHAQMGLGGATAGVGVGLGGKKAQAMARKMYGRQIKRLMGDYTAQGMGRTAAFQMARQQVAEQSAFRMGAALQVSAMYTGSNWAEVMGSTGEDRPMSAALTGTLAGGLTMLGGQVAFIERVLGANAKSQFLNAVKTGNRNVVMNFIKEAAKIGGKAGIEEFGQESFASLNAIWNDPDVARSVPVIFNEYMANIERPLTSAATIAFSSGIPGGVASAAQHTTTRGNVLEEKADFMTQILEAPNEVVNAVIGNEENADSRFSEWRRDDLMSQGVPADIAVRMAAAEVESLIYNNPDEGHRLFAQAERDYMDQANAETIALNKLPEDVQQWVVMHPDEARALAEKDDPTRREFEEMGLPRVNKGKRAQFAKELRDALMPDATTVDKDIEQELLGDMYDSVMSDADFQLEAPTAEKLDTEAAKKKKADELAEAQAKEIQDAQATKGGIVDSTGDMFDQRDADLPLLATPVPKSKGEKVAKADSPVKKAEPPSPTFKSTWEGPDWIPPYEDWRAAQRIIRKGGLEGLMGKANVKKRQELLEKLTGWEHTQKQATMKAVREALYEQAGIPADATMEQRDAKINEWLNREIEIDKYESPIKKDTMPVMWELTASVGKLKGKGKMRHQYAAGEHDEAVKQGIGFYGRFASHLFGGDVDPGTAAQMLYERGLLNEPSPHLMWEEIGKEIEKYRRERASGEIVLRPKSKKEQYEKDRALLQKEKEEWEKYDKEMHRQELLGHEEQEHFKEKVESGELPPLGSEVYVGDSDFAERVYGHRAVWVTDEHGSRIRGEEVLIGTADNFRAENPADVVIAPQEQDVDFDFEQEVGDEAVGFDSERGVESVEDVPGETPGVPETGVVTEQVTEDGRRRSEPVAEERRDQEPADPAAHLKEAGTEIVEGSKELLDAITGSLDLGRMGAGPMQFSMEKYRASKPKFDAAWEHFQKAGKSFAQFVEAALERMGEAGRAYLEQYAKDVGQEMPTETVVPPITGEGRMVDDKGHKITGPRRAISDPERKALDLPEYARPLAREFPDVIDEAWDQQSATVDLAKEIIKDGGRPVTDTEVAQLTILKNQRFNERDAALKKLRADPGNAKLQENLHEAGERLYEVFNAISLSGTATARGLSAFRMAMNEMFDLVEMEQSVSNAYGGKPVTELHKARIQAIKKEFDRREAELQDVIKEREQELQEARKVEADTTARIKFAEIVEDVINEPAVKRRWGELQQRLETRADKAAERIKKKLSGRMGMGPDPSIMADVTDWVASKLAAKVVNWADQAISEFGEGVRPYLADAEKRARAQMKKEYSEIKQAEKVEKPAEEKPPRKAPRQKRGLDGIIKELFREQVEDGVTDLQEAVDNVHEQVHEINPELTKEQVRDLFSDYGKTRDKTSRTEAEKMLYELRRLAQIEASMESVARGIPPARQELRDKMSQRVREAQRNLRRQMREAGITTTDPAHQQASTMRAIESRLKNEIEDVETAIRLHKEIQRDVTPVEYSEHAKELKARLDELRKQYKEIFPPKPLTDEQKTKIALSQAERNLDYWKNALSEARSGRFAKRTTEQPLPYNERLARLRAERDRTKAEVKRLKDLATPKKSPEQIALEARRKRRETLIKEYERRIEEGDFEPKKREELDISHDPRSLAAERRLEEVKQEFAALREEARLEAMGSYARAFHRAGVGYDTIKNVMSAWDYMSGLGRQAMFMGMSNPVLWKRSIAPTFRSISREQTQKIQKDLENSDDWKLAKRGKLAVQEGDGTGNYRRAQDLLNIQWAQKYYPGVAASTRSYVMALNQTRTRLFSQLLDTWYDRGTVTDAELRDLARFVNTTTGYGDVGRHADTLARILWAPRFIKSAFDLATFQPIWTPKYTTPTVRKIALAQYGRMLTTMGAIYVANAFIHGLFGDEEDVWPDWNPTSSKFGAIKVPGTNSYWNPLGFVRPAVNLLARVLTGERKSDRFGRTITRESAVPFASEEMKERGPGTWQRDSMDDIYQFITTKLHPGINAVWQFYTGTGFMGRPQSRTETALRSFTPVPVDQFYDSTKYEDLGATLMLAHLQQWGISSRPDFSARSVIEGREGKDEYNKRLFTAVEAGTRPTSSDMDKEWILMLGSEATNYEIRVIFRDQWRNRGWRIGSDAYNRRMRELNRLLQGREDPGAQ